jgi:hypothetical protein
MRPALILATLQQLHAIHPNGMRAADLTTGIRLMGFPKETPDTLTSLLHDMEQVGLVISKPESLDASVILWTRTEAGRVELVKHGHA